MAELNKLLEVKHKITDLIILTLHSDLLEVQQIIKYKGETFFFQHIF